MIWVWLSVFDNSIQSGKALANGGPVGALLGYMIVGGLTGLMMQAQSLAFIPPR